MDAAASREAVGRRFDVALLQRARERSWAVLEAIRDRMVPGIDEAGARAMAQQVFDEAGDTKKWFQQVVETEIGPLLDEYWFDAPDEAQKACARLLQGW